MAVDGPAKASASAPEPNEEIVACWIKDQVEREQMRLEQAGSKSIPLPVKNMGIIREGRRIVNRIEVNTAFDFDKVQEILLSEPVACPLKPGFSYVHVLLFTDKPIPIILPYLYDTNVSTGGNNKLEEWVFLNNKLARSRHRVKGGFTAVK